MKTPCNRLLFFTLMLAPIGGWPGMATPTSAQEVGPTPFGNDTSPDDGVRFASAECPPPVPEIDVAALADRVAELEKQLADQHPGPLDMSTAWGKNGCESKSEKDNFKFHVGGRVQLDAVALNADDLRLGGVGDDDAVGFRRARLRADGTMYGTMSFAAESDFVTGINEDPLQTATPLNAFGGNVVNDVVPTDLWVLFDAVPLVNQVRIGNQKAPIGLEHLNSSRFLDFMERSYLQDAFYGPFNNGFVPGVSIHDWTADEHATYTLGVYRNNQNPFGYDTGDNEYLLAGRLSWAPVLVDEGCRLVHFGLGVSHQGLDQDAAAATGNLRVRNRASLRNGPGPLNPVLGDTSFSGRILADNETLVCPEVAVVNGPWHLQGEYVGGFINGALFTPNGGATAAAPGLFVQGAYGQISYFLTGEHRVYEAHEGRFGRVTPGRNATFMKNGCGLSGPGAWQVLARYGMLDLNDGPLLGGEVHDLTLGVNWFINPFAKVQVNWIAQWVDNQQVNAQGAIVNVNDSVLYGLGTRFAWDF